MKHHLHKLVDITKLKSFLKGLDFPKSDDELEKLAKDNSADTSVVEFFEAIDEATVFESVQDVITQAEEVNLLRTEEAEAPPEEYTIDEY